MKKPGVIEIIIGLIFIIIFIFCIYFSFWIKTTMEKWLILIIPTAIISAFVFLVAYFFIKKGLNHLKQKK